MDDIKTYTPGLHDRTVGKQKRQQGINVHKLRNDAVNILLTQEVLRESSLYLIPVIKDSKIGFINRMGELVSTPQYDDVCGHFYSTSSIVGVKKDGLWSAIDADGNELLPFKYTTIFPSRDSSIAVVHSDYKWEAIDTKNGRIVAPKGKFSYMFGFRYGFAKVKMNNKWGIINTRGELVVPAEYTDMFSFDTWDRPETQVRKEDKGTLYHIDLTKLPQ